MSSPVRILALCGYSQNAITFASSLRGALLQASNDWSAPSSWSPLSGNLQKFQLPPGAAEQGDRLGSITTKSRDGRAEFTFLDPPIVLGREHLAPVHVKEYEKNLREAEKKTHVTPRAWWLAPDRDTYAEYDNSVQYISDFLSTQEKPFDGVIGFSQGAAMAAALTALLEKDGLSSAFSRGSAPPLKFAIAVGGFKPRSKTPDFSAYFPIQTPVLHVVGAQDPVVSAKASKQLQEATPVSRAVGHDGGHWTPGNSHWQKFFGDFIASMGKGGKLGDTPAPGEDSARL